MILNISNLNQHFTTLHLAFSTAGTLVAYQRSTKLHHHIEHAEFWIYLIWNFPLLSASIEIYIFSSNSFAVK
jgi:hypothetical protein